MAAPVNGGDLEALLRQMAHLLRPSEPSWSRRFAQLADEAASTLDPGERRELASRILRLYGGMGSFADVVLQDSSGVLPEQDALDELSSRLYEAARSASMASAVPLPPGTPRVRVRRLANRGLLGRKATYEVEVLNAGEPAATSATRSITRTAYSQLKPLIGWDEAILVERRASEAWSGAQGPWVEAYTGRVLDE